VRRLRGRESRGGAFAFVRLKPNLRARTKVERLVMLGAKVLDDPPDDPWIVLADPEGHEFCVLPPR